MKYILISLLALALCMLVSAAAIRAIHRRRPLGLPLRALLTVGLGALLMGAVSLIYLGHDYRAEPDARACLQGSDAVQVTPIEGGYFFDGAGDGTAAIFYPGAKVEETAYAPLLRDLAARGLDGFLVKMPFHMAMFDMNAAERLIHARDYARWVLIGHSLGGSAAALCAAENADDIDALILLAAYPTRPVGVRLLSIYGSLDGCLDRGAYAKSKSLWPGDAVEVVIDGGNHAQFGGYGLQRGDGAATLSPDAQRRQTVDAITRFIQEPR